MVALPVNVAPELRVLEPMVPPLMVMASATSLSAHGLAVFTQSAEIVSACESDAGPPVPQSSRTITSSELEAERAKWAGSKEREATWASENTPVSFTCRYPPAPPLVSVSVPQEKVPFVTSQRSFEVAAVSQSERPEPYVLEAEA